MPREYFATTQWTMILHAQGEDSQAARDALARLCRTYWFPLYAFVRRRGHSPEDAEDLTQEFFARLLRCNWIEDARRERGRFRSFLLAALKHFLANEWDRARASKRGGGQVPVSLNDTNAEGRYQLEPADTMSADRIFERRWAMTLLDGVMARLRAEHVAAGKTEFYNQLKPCLIGARASAPYAEIAARLGMSEGAVKVAVHRLRQRYRTLLREEISQTVTGPDEVDEELRYLQLVLAG